LVIDVDGSRVPFTGQRVVRRTLGRRLTRLRIAADLSRHDVAQARLGISEPTLYRIETGKAPVSAANVRALCWLYGTDQSVADALAEFALGTSHAEWWDASPVVPDWFKLYVGLEASASRIRSYDGEVVPGELQTEQYARAVFGAERPVGAAASAASLAGAEAVDRQVKLRMQRQQTLLTRTPAPVIVTVLGEGVLRRTVGRPGVLKAQVEHLCQLAGGGQVQIRVLPFAAGAHPAMAGPFRILDFDDPDDPDLVYLESHVGALYLDEQPEIDEYRRIFDTICRTAVPIEEF
jgi:transcriptional regulator with XRE-family HTH domain